MTVQQMQVTATLLRAANDMTVHAGDLLMVIGGVVITVYTGTQLPAPTVREQTASQVNPLKRGRRGPQAAAREDAEKRITALLDKHGTITADQIPDDISMYARKRTVQTLRDRGELEIRGLGRHTKYVKINDAPTV